MRDGEDTVVNKIVAHDKPSVSFNSIEYATVCNDLYGVISVSSIQPSTTIVASYLIGLRRTQNNNHWARLMNHNSKLKNIDANIVTKKIEVNLSTPWKPKNGVRAAHMYCLAPR